MNSLRMTREQIVKMTRKTLAQSLSRVSKALPMSDKHRRRLEEMRKQKNAEK